MWFFLYFRGRNCGGAAVIEVEKLTMHYGSVVAVENVSFQVRPREVVALLGPNGAGKSTIMKILTTYLWPTSGTAKVCGRNILTEPIEVRKRIGYLPEVLPLYMDMEVETYLSFVGRARGMDRVKLKNRLKWAVEKCGLRSVYRTLIRELSKGYKQRTALAQALLHDPEVIILDEPTSGLDPHQIIQIRKLTRELAEEKTVILSTHILQEAEAVSDRIVIISQGNIVADGTLSELQKKAMEGHRVEAALTAGREDVEQAFRGLVDAKDLKFIEDGSEITRFQIQTNSEKDLIKMISELASNKGWNVRELLDRPYTLEETFLALTEPEEERGAA